MPQAIFNNLVIETDRLVLRNFMKSDKNEFYDIVQDPKLYATLPEDHMYTYDEVNEIVNWFIERYEKNTINDIAKFPLAIKMKENNKMIGDIGIGQYSQDKKEIEVFYFINSQYWNQGYASEAMEAFMKYLMRNRIVNHLIANYVKGNIASEKYL